MKHTVIAALIALVASLAATVAPVAASTGPSMIKGDFAGFCCVQMTALGSMVIFVADDGVGGSEVWRSDGTYAGTKQMSSIRPGTGPSNPRFLTRAGNYVFFTANNGSHGEELWRTDGTRAGTLMIKNIRPGAASSFPDQLAEANGILYFSPSDGTHGRELWRSDGTTAGTYMVADLNPGSGSSYPTLITPYAGKVYFRANDKLWRSDGTAAGTTVVRNRRNDIVKNPQQLTVAGGLLYYTTKNVFLWRSDGTKLGTRRIATFGQACADRYCHTDSWGMTSIGSELFFTADTDTVTYGIWKSNGTSAGTQLITDLGGGSHIDHQTDIGGGLVVFNRSSTLWRTDGTSAGTAQLGGPELCYSWERGNAVLYFGGAPVDGGVGCDGDEIWAVTNNGTGLAALGPVSDLSVIELEFGDGNLWIRMQLNFGEYPGQLWRYVS